MREVKKPLCNRSYFLWLLSFRHAFLPARRKDTGRVTDPLTDLLTDPLTDLLTDPLTDLLKDLLTKPSIEGPDWKTEAGLETRPAGRIPEGFQTILVIWSPGPLWRPVKL